MIDHRIDRKAADERIRGIDHRRRHQVVALERARRILGRILGMKTDAVGDHHLGDLLLQVRDDDSRKRQRALQALRAIDDEKLIRMAGQLVQAAQVSRRRFHRHVVANGDVLEIHQRADRAFRIGERRAQPRAFFQRQRLHHLLHDAGREVCRDVGELVGFERLGRGDELGRIHRLDERLAYRLGNLDEDFAVAIGLDEVPDGKALFERQRLEQEGDVGRVERVEPRAQLAALRLVGG